MVYLICYVVYVEPCGWHKYSNIGRMCMQVLRDAGQKFIYILYQQNDVPARGGVLIVLTETVFGIEY